MGLIGNMALVLVTLGIVAQALGMLWAFLLIEDETQPGPWWWGKALLVAFLVIFWPVTWLLSRWRPAV